MKIVILKESETGNRIAIRRDRLGPVYETSKGVFVFWTGADGTASKMMVDMKLEEVAAPMGTISVRAVQ